ncbi:hypothetical protein BH10BAC3_BH10BAC3_16920 [soil metagenome]
MRKMKFLFLTVGLLTGLSSYSQQSAALAKMLQRRLASSTTNLVPETVGNTPSYWCTWSAQNFATDSLSLVSSIGLGDHRIFSDNLTEEAVFKNPGWQQYIPQSIRKDLFLVFDVGWDIPGGTVKDKSKFILGTLNVATDKFPGMTGTPAERLKKLNELTRSFGWKGAGLWIAAQTEMDSRGAKDISDEEVEGYFRERARWCKVAGIDYWKVDYGSRGGSNEFRQMLTRVAAEEAPELLVENGRGSGPLNDEECPWDTKNFHGQGRYLSWDDGAILKKAVSLLQFSDVLRTYDVTAQLSIATTIDRVAQILAQIKTPVPSKGIINCEDEMYVGAALGCAVGIMRHPLFISVKGNDYNPLKVNRSMDEVTRAVRWQRIAPAFKAGQVGTLLDTAILKDTWFFRKGDSWAAWMIGKTGMQAAPAIVARGLALPVVKGKSVPYVLASKNPNGAVTIATLQRVDAKRNFYFPHAAITLAIGDADNVGIFGEYQSLTLQHNSNKPMKIWAQDLAGNNAIDITDLVKQSSNKITLSGLLLQKLGTMQATKGDVSEPGLLLVLKAQ